MYKFTKANRILNKLEYKTVLDNGSKAVTDLLVVYGQNHPGATRIGLIVSKKVGGAVTRNQVKRRLREIFRLRLPSLDAYPGADFVVIARYTAGNAEFADLAKALDQSISRIHHRLKLQPAIE